MSEEMQRAIVANRALQLGLHISWLHGRAVLDRLAEKRPKNKRELAR